MNRKADFFTKRIDSHNESNRIDSNRELECYFVDRIYDGRDASLPGTYIVDYTSVDCNLLTPLLRFFVDFLYNLFIQLCSCWPDFDCHSASRGPYVCGSRASCSKMSPLILIPETINSVNDKLPGPIKLLNFEARAYIGLQKNLDFINKNVRLD